MVLPLPALLPRAALANVVVKEGDTLSEIADRNGVSLKRLMQANGLSNPGKLAVGQTLVIPGGGRYSSPGPIRTTSARGGTITVKDGDTLSEIADRSGVSLKRLMQANGLNNAGKLAVGQTLVIPGGGRYSNQAAAPKSISPAPYTVKISTAPYTVKKGETISELAERFGTSTDRLLKLNNISDPKLVIAGTRIAVPGRASSARTSRTYEEYVVQSGESLSYIADRYNTSVDQLVAINNLDDPNMVVTGTRIKLLDPPTLRPAPRQAPRPTPKPRPVVQTAAKPVVASKPAVTSKPVVAVKPVAASQPMTTAPATAQPIAMAATAAPVAASAPAVAVATAPDATSRSGGKLAASEWRNYGPIQVDWANWQAMGGSFVAPTINSKGQPLYLSINCGVRKLNTTSQVGQWKTWESPQADFEEQLVTDLCKTKGG